MEKYNVYGMHCAACSSRVEKAVSSLEGVLECNVNLLTNSMTVSGDISSKEVIEAVRKAGYEAEIPKSNAILEEKNLNQDSEVKSLTKRLITSVIFLLPIMYLSMGHMLSLPLPAFISENHIITALIEMVLTVFVMIINKSFFINGFKSLFSLSPTMDTLVALGSSASFVYSLVVLLLIATNKNNIPNNNLYFESAAMILTLITVGKLLEAISKGKTTSALKDLMDLTPKSATVIRDGKEITVKDSEVVIGDIFIVRTGESIAVDGVVIEGEGAIDESAITGESIPREVSVGDKVFGATHNKSGYIKVKATEVGEDTTIAKIIKMVSDASSSKAPIAKIADKVSGVFVPAVMLIALLTFIGWIIVGQTVGYSLARAISVLVISCPCALGLATPVSIMVGNGVGARNGILFKTASVLEETGRVKNVALDKTGTITNGNPVLTDIIPNENLNEKAFLELVSSLEYKSEHPLARPIVEYAEKNGINIPDSADFTVFSGSGVSAVVNGHNIMGGNLKFISEKINISDSIIEISNELASHGKTPLLFCMDNEYIGMVALSDVEKTDSKQAIRELEKMGINAIMITGDNKITAQNIAKRVGIKKVVSDVLPSQKKEIIEDLKNTGKTMMVGDGINDAPALVCADIGVAIGSGTDIAIDSADIVLAGGSLLDVVSAIKLSRATLRNIKQNLFWAFIYNAIGIPLAAGLFVYLLGLELSPMFGALSMSISSFLVVTNSLRLNLIKLNHNSQKKGNRKMKKTLVIEGMMCAHCEANVKNALAKIDGVKDVEVSAKKGTAVVTVENNIDDQILKTAVENSGYKVLNIE
ncbi:MAG: heavy metal translocating P-type ATPase [Clostridia bacterium]|nr:heavy metal translocating P-type ATPase [Clostridia bacterium]